LLEPVLREAQLHALISVMEKIALEQARKLAMDGQENDSAPIAHTRLEVLPPLDQRELSHERGWTHVEILLAPGPPHSPEQRQAHKLALLLARQPEGRGEPAQEGRVVRIDVPLHRRTAAEELEPARVHAISRRIFAVTNGVHEALRSVEAPPSDFGREIAPGVALQRSNEI
jgi:hypothetical protein